MTTLITPYRGDLVDLFINSTERAELLARAALLPSITLSERAFEDLELLASGGFSPLRTFLGKEDHDRVLAEMRLADGTLWPIPIVLPVKETDRVTLDREVALRGPRNQILAVMTVTDVFPFDPRGEASALFGRFDEGHPLAAEMLGWGKHLVSGPLRVIDVPKPVDFRELRLRPREVRERLAALGSSRVVAFQTRNPLHRSHEELTKRAAERCGGTLLLHPVVGRTRPGDVDHFTRVRTYRALVSRYYDPARTLLSLLPLAMRMAGPREALWHGIVRRNHGASHFIVGRDHAGPAPGRDGRPFFGPYDAQELFEKHQAEIGVEMLAFREFVFLPDERRYEEEDKVPREAKTLTISGTRVRRDYLAKGVPLPEWYTRPETAEILLEASPAREKRGFCVWFTGLSGAGKSVTAETLAALLLEAGRRVTLLDGDVVRTHLSKGLGFSREDRDTNIRRIGWVAAEVARHGGAVICAAISPYRAARAEVRALAGDAEFLEVFVDTPIEVCEKRDEKGLYAQARAGKLKGFTGVDDPYETPETPEIRLETTSTTIEENARKILAELARRGLVGE